MTADRRSLLPPLILGAVVLAATVVPSDRATPAKPAEKSRLMDAVPATMAAAQSTALALMALPSPSRPVREPLPSAASVPVSAKPFQPQAATVVHPTASQIGHGRLLLERIERGEGPSIEIAWPDDRADRSRLLEHLERCAGWTRLLVSDGRLWRAVDAPGQPWTPKPGQAPSGLLRDVDGVAAGDPAIATIRARHRLDGGVPVASVDRAWDARLLGLLAQLLGPGWINGSVRARYLIVADRLLVADIRLDGRAVPGRADLGGLARCAR